MGEYNTRMMACQVTVLQMYLLEFVALLKRDGFRKPAVPSSRGLKAPKLHKARVRDA